MGFNYLLTARFNQNAMKTHFQFSYRKGNTITTQLQEHLELLSN